MVKADELYQGPMMTGAEDSTAYLFNLINVALFMSLATAFILSCVLITREFDEGVHIHVYYEKRTRNVLARGAVVLIFTVVFFLAMYLFLCKQKRVTLSLEAEDPDLHTSDLLLYQQKGKEQVLQQPVDSLC